MQRNAQHILTQQWEMEKERLAAWETFSTIKRVYNNGTRKISYGEKSLCVYTGIILQGTGNLALTAGGLLSFV